MNRPNRLPFSPFINENIFNPVLKSLLILFGLSFCIMARSQADSSYSFLVAGHAYGSHTGGNTGLHPALLNRLNAGFAPDAAFIVFTGDIVNQSTTESWTQVETELQAFPFDSYYAMGNHDANATGLAVFEAKHGGTYYSFHNQHSLFIVLNSTQVQRSIAPEQLVFLGDLLTTTADSIKNVFIFFHEILWNSHEKYIGVRSNSRSRYDQMVAYSNYWEDVHPMLISYPDINFYLITGDVGGNPDAIAIFYDTWDNVTLLSSGMGEVPDENYLCVHVVHEDSISFEPVPLNETLELDSLHYYSVPPAVGEIAGPGSVVQGSSDVEYSIQKAFNATSYLWEIPENAEGTSTDTSILVNFNGSFLEGTLRVRAERDGFGTGPESTKPITGIINSNHVLEDDPAAHEPQIVQYDGKVWLQGNTLKGGELRMNLFSLNGQVLFSEKYSLAPGEFKLPINPGERFLGEFFVSLWINDHYVAKRIVLF